MVQHQEHQTNVAVQVPHPELLKESGLVDTEAVVGSSQQLQRVGSLVRQLLLVNQRKNS